MDILNTKKHTILNMLHSFPPIVGQSSQILIIGSMPGAASLQAQQYYAYKQNAFWKIIFDVFENRRTPADYEDKKTVILKHHLALWDSLSACERTGSLDGNISRPLPNDFPALFKQYPSIKALLFNGRASFHFYTQAFGKPGYFYKQLPSTSPAHASLRYEEKRDRWRQVLLEALSVK